MKLCMRYEMGLSVWDSYMQKRDFGTIIRSKHLFFLTHCKALSKVQPKSFFEISGQRIVACLMLEDWESMKKVVESIRVIFLSCFERNEEVSLKFRFEDKVTMIDPQEIQVPSKFFEEYIKSALPKLDCQVFAEPRFYSNKNGYENYGFGDHEIVAGYNYSFSWPQANRLAEHLYQMSLRGEACDVKVVSTKKTVFELHSFALRIKATSFLNDPSNEEYSDFVLRIFSDYVYVGHDALSRLQDRVFPPAKLDELSQFAERYNLEEIKAAVKTLR